MAKSTGSLSTCPAAISQIDHIARTADSDVFTTKRGYRKTTSVGGALTGLGGNLFIIDDPQK